MKQLNFIIMNKNSLHHAISHFESGDNVEKFEVTQNRYTPNPIFLLLGKRKFRLRKVGVVDVSCIRDKIREDGAFDLNKIINKEGDAKLRLPRMETQSRKEKRIKSPQPKTKVFLCVNKNDENFKRIMEKIIKKKRDESKVMYGGADKSVLERLMNKYSQK